MRELSLNILDIAQNSVTANSKNVTVSIKAKGNLLSISIADDGKGMSKEFLKKVVDPFTTTRTTRKVGLGIPLFKQAAEESGGTFSISSELGKGTTTEASFLIDSIDRMPLGDVAGTITTLIMANPSIDYVLNYTVEDRNYVFDTKEVKQILDGVPIDSVEIIAYLGELITENIITVNGGTVL